MLLLRTLHAVLFVVAAFSLSFRQSVSLVKANCVLVLLLLANSANYFPSFGTIPVSVSLTLCCFLRTSRNSKQHCLNCLLGIEKRAFRCYLLGVFSPKQYTHSARMFSVISPILVLCMLFAF